METALTSAGGRIGRCQQPVCPRTSEQARIPRRLSHAITKSFSPVSTVSACIRNRFDARRHHFAQAKSGKDAKAPPPSSYDQISPTLLGNTFDATRTKDKADKPAVLERHKKLLDGRYDLGSKPDKNAKMSRGKPIQTGPATKLPQGMTWAKLSEMSSEDIREKGLFPAGFLPLPHPKHDVGGMVFPQMQLKQFPRLERFDIDFDLPEHFLPEFPPAIMLPCAPTWGTYRKAKS